MGVKFFRKNLLDLDNDNISFTITDLSASDTGSSFIDLVRNRDNNSGWATTGSADGGSTTIVADFGEERLLDNILLVGHNFKNYNLKYWDGTNYINFSTPITESTNSTTTTHYSFTSVSTSKIQLIVDGAMVADADKYLKQMIATEIIGTLSIQPELRPQFDKDRKATKFLSGKQFVAKSVGGFNLDIKMKSASNDTDLTLIETLFNAYNGFLVWPSGGDVSQFETIRHGYRLQDIFLMDVVNEYSPEFIESRWYNGLPINIKLVEVS